MNIAQMYILVAIVVFAVIAVLVFVVGEKGNEKKLTPLASLAFSFVLAGLLFGDDRWIGYGLMGIGVILAVLDMFNKSKRTS